MIFVEDPKRATHNASYDVYKMARSILNPTEPQTWFNIFRYWLVNENPPNARVLVSLSAFRKQESLNENQSSPSILV